MHFDLHRLDYDDHRFILRSVALEKSQEKEVAKVLLKYFEKMKKIIFLFILLKSFSSEAFDLECANSNNSTCVVNSLKIETKNEEIENVKGNTNFPKIEAVYILGQKVKFLPSNLGKKLSALTNLTVQRSELEEISREDFKGIENLKLISFHNNDLAQIERNVFYDLQLLEELDLSNNLLSSLDPKVFIKLISLKIINLDANDFSEIDAGLFRHNKNLESVSLKTNNLITIPTLIFETLKSLKSVVLSSNELQSLPDQLFAKNENLKEVFVVDNEITSIGSKNIEIFSNLDEFNFLHNPCTRNLKEDSSSQELSEILEKDCQPNDETTIGWLRNLVEEMGRFKREDADQLKCAEMELMSYRNDVNATRDELFIRLQSTNELIKSPTGQSNVPGVQSNVKTELDPEFKNLKDEISKSESKVVKAINEKNFILPSETSQLLNSLATEDSLKAQIATVNQNIKTELATNLKSVTDRLNAGGFSLNAETLEFMTTNTRTILTDLTTLKNDLTTIKTKIEDFPRTIDDAKVSIESKVEGKLLKKSEDILTQIESLKNEIKTTKCNYHEKFWKLVANEDSGKVNNLIAELNKIKINEDGTLIKWDSFDALDDDQKTDLKNIFGSNCLETSTETQ